MRKRLTMIGTVMAIAAGLFVIVGLFATAPNTGPFKFLEGQTLIIPPTTSDRPMERAYYSFKADYETVVKAARRELSARDYKDVTSHGSPAGEVRFVIGDWDAYVNSPSRDTFRKFQSVYVLKDKRLDEYEDVVDAPGWVVVRIIGKPTQTILERLRSWIGL